MQACASLLFSHFLIVNEESDLKTKVWALENCDEHFLFGHLAD